MVAETWATLGYRLGEAYQVADDLRDVMCTEKEIGKPVGQDKALGRPNMVHELGVQGAARKLVGLIEEAAEFDPRLPRRAGAQGADQGAGRPLPARRCRCQHAA